MKKLFNSVAETSSITAFDVRAAQAEIATNNERFGQAVEKGNAEMITSLYHTQAKAYPPHGEMINQREQAGAFFAALPGMGVKTITLKSTEVFGGPDDIIETGTYEVSDGNQIVDNGKYLVVWRQENGQLKIYRDIWNSDRPPQASTQ